VHDLSDGGLLVALAEMAMVSGIGAALDAPFADIAPHAFWFGEDQARYVVTVRATDADATARRLRAHGVTVTRIGTTGGATLRIAGERALAVEALSQRFEAWLPAYMADELTNV